MPMSSSNRWYSSPAYHWKQWKPAGRTAGYRSSTASSRPPVPQSPYTTITRSYFGSRTFSFSSTAGAISSGVMCRSDEMPWTSASQPCRSISAAVSCATAPQARNATFAPVAVTWSRPAVPRDAGGVCGLRIGRAPRASGTRGCR